MKGSGPAGPGLPETVDATAVLDACPEALVFVASDGSVRYWNAAAERLTGLGHAAACGKHWLDAGLIPKGEEANNAEFLLKALAGQDGVGLEFRSSSAPNSQLHLKAVAEPVRRDGGVVGVVISLRDISEQRRLEESLRIAQRQESVGKLATGLAHDFNNVLTVVKGYCELIVSQGELPTDAAKQLRGIATAAERGATLTRQLLTFSRRLALEVRPLDLNEVVGNFSQMLRRLLRENIAVEFKFAPQLPPVEVDLGLLEQILSSMVLHGGDAMPAGGRLIVQTAKEKTGPHTAQVCLAVKDTGRSLEKAALARLVEPAKEASISEHVPRMGLQIAAEAAAQMKGRLEATSQPGDGTTLKLYLPTSKKRLEDAAQVTPVQKSRGGKETILVVEDEPSIRELARAILSGYGYRVLEAGSGEEAMALWAKEGEKVDLLFTDIVMPGAITGRILAQNLEALKPGLKVIYTTGYSLDLLHSNLALRAGVNLLPKPYRASALAQAVRASLDAGR